MLAVLMTWHVLAATSQDQWSRMDLSAEERNQLVASAKNETKQLEHPAAVMTVRVFHQNIVVTSAAEGGELTDEQKRALTMVLGSIPENEKEEGVVWTISRLERSLNDEELALMLKKISGISDTKVAFGPLTAEIQPLSDAKQTDLAGRKEAPAMEQPRTEISITLK